MDVLIGAGVILLLLELVAVAVVIRWCMNRIGDFD